MTDRAALLGRVLGRFILLSGMAGLIAGVTMAVDHAVKQDLQTRSQSFAEGFLSGCGGGPTCIITYNGGGIINNFIEVAKLIKQRGKIVVIDGRCASACAVMADLARDWTCLMPSAVLAFHRASDDTVPPDSPDVLAWVEAHGGFPDYGSQAFTEMKYSNGALLFFAPCPVRAHGPISGRQPSASATIEAQP